MNLYRPLPGLLVRAPLLPAAAFASSGAGPERWWADGEFRFAVTVASPDLAASMDAALGVFPGAPGAAPPSERARGALQRYLIRAATRPTPFGGFAAVGMARWGAHTDLAVAPGHRPTRTRPDLAWLTDLAARLAADPQCRDGLRFYANSSALERDGRVHLADPGTGGTRGGPDVSIRATPPVRRALAGARDGVTWSELRRRLVAPGTAATPQRVERLLAQLAEQQFLLPELLPALTGDPLAHVLKALDAGVAEIWSARLGAVAAACRAVDGADPANATALITALRAQLSEVASPAVPAIRTADVQVDSALPLFGTTLNATIAADVAGAVDVLFKLHPNPAWTPLAGYRAAFHRRYGEGRRVGLLELLDSRFGLGAPSDHPNDSHTAHAGHEPEAEARRADTLRALVATATRDDCAEVVLDDRLVSRLSTWTPEPGRLPPSVELSVFVAAHDSAGIDRAGIDRAGIDRAAIDRAAIDRGDYRLLVGPNLGAQAAGRGLGRFADLLDPAASDLLSAAARAEEAAVGADRPGGPVVAELVYRPLRARSANVAVRPLVRGHELPVGVAATLPPDRVVRVDELSVELSGGRLRVWWDREQRPLLLSAGHMLNPSAAPPLCRALLDLTGDGGTYLPSFDWGPMAAMPFLPRVRHGRVVLSPAQWRLDPTVPEGDFDARLDSWRRDWRVPRLVHLTSADNRLLLDLDEPTHRGQLAAALRTSTRAVLLQEGIPGPDDAWLPGPAGRHVVELVVPLIREHREAPVPHARAAAPGVRDAALDTAQRIRPPGSEWLYVTMDGPRHGEDALLAGPLGELLDGVLERGDADGWFFVRYADPQRQLRVRVHGEPGVLLERVLPALARWGAGAIATGTRTRLAVQPYERELERYGGPLTTAVCERLACADSAAVRGLLRVDGTRPDRLDPVELALLSTADLLGSLAGDDPAETARWASDLAAGVSEAGAAYRERKVRLRALLQAGRGGSWAAVGEPWVDAGPPVAVVLARRRAAIAPLVAALGEHWSDGTGQRSPRDLAGSIVHLHANRLGLDRAGERLVLGLLERTLRSLVAHPHTAPRQGSRSTVGDGASEHSGGAA